ncbi:DNA polymerase III subunit beta [Blattabacterium cuenoti]|uniref:DNA polymerase III subunit beta n=1 Tax=Blattabacterium cuenoti TaxID=1653831 RepID=UPI00163B6366|nr:DNA polymerase III subunit beta [Blattabacterium cuenoti]
MYFSVSNISLLQKLRLLHRIIKSNKNSEHFIFEIFGEKLIIMFSDSDSENIIKTEIQVYVKKYSKEKVSVHSQLIIDILSTFLDEIILIKFIKEKKILNICSKQGNYDIPILLWDKNHILNDFFKNLKEIEKETKKITIFSNVFFNILKKTSFIIENKEELPSVINGVFFQFSSERSTFVATDTYKLVKYTINHIQLDQLIEFILPKKSIEILKKFLLVNKPNKKSKVTIEYRNKIDIKFHFMNETFSCLLSNKKYPNYNSVIPIHKYDVLFIINRVLFLNSIKRISLLSNLNKKKTSFIRFYFDKKLKIYEEYDENIYSFLTIQYEFIDNSLQKKEIKIGFNSKFLIEILSSFNEDFVSFELYTSNKVGILRPINNQNKRKESILILIMSVII